MFLYGKNFLLCRTRISAACLRANNSPRVINHRSKQSRRVHINIAGLQREHSATTNSQSRFVVKFATISSKGARLAVICVTTEHTRFQEHESGGLRTNKKDLEIATTAGIYPRRPRPCHWYCTQGNASALLEQVAVKRLAPSQMACCASSKHLFGHHSSTTVFPCVFNPRLRPAASAFGARMEVVGPTTRLLGHGVRVRSTRGRRTRPRSKIGVMAPVPSIANALHPVDAT